MSKGHVCHLRVWIPGSARDRQGAKTTIYKMITNMLTDEIAVEFEGIAFKFSAPEWVKDNKVPVEIEKTEKLRSQVIYTKKSKNTTNEKKRNCLSCGDEFLSSGFGNRMCEKCRKLGSSPFEPFG